MKAMEHATTTPPNVRRAVAIYSSRRRWFGAASALLTGIALATGLALIFMVADRYSQLPQFVRDAGPKLAEIALLGAVIAAIVALVRRHNAFSIAVRLDEAFPQHLDRWSSSMDLAEQIAAGQNAGDKASLDRLFSDTEALPAVNAKSIVSAKTLRVSVAA
ncbi:MAG TPA: hypothetical protein VFC46_15180, partial [Humisphaera sp.]|nr:hypothetical protein [Humisphaera sp.]